MPAYALITQPKLPKISFRSSRYAGLGETQQITPEFANQISTAQGALTELTAIAKTISITTTDPAIKNAADLALQFTQGGGPRILNDALIQGDPRKVAAVQDATKKIISALSPEVIPAIVSRFIAMVVLGPAGAVVSADMLDSAKEDARAMLPDFLNKQADAKELARLIKFAIVGGVTFFGLISVAYFVRAFK